MKRHNVILHAFLFYKLICLCTDEKTSHELSLYSGYDTREGTSIYYLFIAKRNKLDILCIAIKQHPLLLCTMKRCGLCIDERCEWKNNIYVKCTLLH